MRKKPTISSRRVESAGREKGFSEEVDESRRPACACARRRSTAGRKRGWPIPHSSVGLIAELQLFSGVEGVVDVDAGVEGLEVDLDRIIVEDVVCIITSQRAHAKACELDPHSCRSLNPNSIGPLIFANPRLASFRFRAAHRLPLCSIASRAPFPTALDVSRASNIQALRLLVTASRTELRNSGTDESMRVAKG
jgi:hypothetical protein